MMASVFLLIFWDRKEITSLFKKDNYPLAYIYGHVEYPQKSKKNTYILALL